MAYQNDTSIITIIKAF